LQYEFTNFFSFHFQDEESLGWEEEVEHAGREEDLEVVGLEETSDGGRGGKGPRLVGIFTNLFGPFIN
jgi:hypothetical protein